MSEALRLADALEQQFPIGTAQHYLDGEAAAELRRLHAENEALQSENRTLVRQNGQWQALNAELVEALLYVNERSSGESVKKDEFERRIADALVKWEASK